MCRKYKRDPRVSDEDMAWLKGQCASCINFNGFHCEVSNHGRDAGDGKTYVSDSGREIRWEDDCDDEE